MSRHNIKINFSLKQVIDNKIVDIDTKNWTDISAEGLARFLRATNPHWQSVIVTKHRIIYDPQKQQGDNIVSKKQSTLKLTRLNSFEVQSVKVDENLTKNGKIPSNISMFFVQKQK